MFPETEGFLVAIQDQVIPTNNYKRFILKNLQQSDKCRYGCQDSETIQHVTGGCQAFAPTDYKERHDIAAKIIHQELAYKFKLIECKLQYYKYTPQCVLENDKYKLYWDRTVLTDQYIKQNRPDIIIVDKDAQKVTLIDVAIPNSNNLTYKHNEKVAKYRELEFQIKRQWKMKKAFDSVPHSWLLKSLKLIGTSEKIIDLCKRLISLWSTTLLVSNKGEEIELGPIQIKRGIYQGDTLSPLLFVIAMVPLSTLLNEANLGYQLKGANDCLSHLLYMDDLKLISPSQNKLKTSLNIVKKFSDDIQMSFGLDKCAVVTFRRGMHYDSANIIVDEGQTIKSLEHGGVYKYLGIKEGPHITHDSLKVDIRHEYITRVRKILQTQLTSRNKITAIGALAIPIMQYSFGIINWTLDDIRQMDRKTRKLMTTHNILHPKADIDRLYVPRKKGGRGLKQIEETYNNTIFSVGQYIQTRSEQDRLLQMLLAHDNRKPTNRSIVKRSNKIKLEAAEAGHTVERGNRSIKLYLKQCVEEKWRSKPLHGQHIRQMEELPVDLRLSFGWLQYGDLKGETESLLVAAQDQALKTRYIEQAIHKTRNDGKCRLCHIHNETVEHIISACPILAPKEYTDRHNNVCAAIHLEVSRHLGCPIKSTKWYEHHPDRITRSEDGSITIMYDHPVITDREIKANRPDIVIKTTEICYIIDISVPADRHVIQKEAEKQIKYKSLLIVVQRMWHTKAVVIPVVIGATGYVTRNILDNLKRIPGDHNFYQLQKIALLGTSHIIRKVIT
ncbi:unnamed protein product [Acanthoscelides obtectus]|uniref:Reverse transcriptase domain-containing protein n=1 Tax=Acanthoscelides obtectus TaxID=200917 RepID=A0A9P0QEY5_ACAOB|nr:unnamed protein product [Acanthoscelides obtectus]CAK1670189.1 hypothetical protein AOBTE_LOCUS27458 [Acanthoscelides obtectus]